MAVMYPQEINECLSDGERKVFNEFKDKLSEDWTVFYSLRWVTEDDFHGNQSNGEVDFMENDEKRKLLYVAMSRAKVHVILIVNTENMNRKQRASYKNDIVQQLLRI